MLDRFGDGPGRRPPGKLQPALRFHLHSDGLLDHLPIRHVVEGLEELTEVAIGVRVRHERAVVLPSVGSVDELTQYATPLEGVEDAEWSLPVRTYDFPHWFDERLDDLSSSDRYGAS